MEKKYIVSFSGGKDSTAMLLRMLELNMQVDKIVFADTRLEFPEVYDYIKKVEKVIRRKITIVRAKKSWDDWFYGKFTRGFRKGQIRGFPKCHIVDWCSRSLKQVPLHKFEEGNIVYLGIAFDEKNRIQKKTNRRIVKYPLIEWGWTEEDCLNYLKEKNLLNPLYKKFKRLGCWYCPKQNLKSLRILFKDYPKLWKKLKKMGKDSPIKFRTDYSVEDLEIKFKEEVRNSSQD